MTNLPSGLPETIQDNEPIARFLTQSNYFKKDRIDPSAFLPSPRDKETSVSRHDREPIQALKSLGATVANASNRTLYGAAIISGKDVLRASLQITADEPPDRHAVIRGWFWSDSDPRQQKALQKEKALILAGAAGAPILFGENQP